MCSNCNGTGRTLTEQGAGMYLITPCTCPIAEKIRKESDARIERIKQKVREERERLENGQRSNSDGGKKLLVSQTL